MSADKITVPWTPEQIQTLENHQNCGYFHPYTCGNNSLHENLIPTVFGWICPNCDYKQNWAHFMDSDNELFKIFSKATENARKLPETDW